MREWESLEVLVAKDCWKAFGTKLLHVVDETFCSIPTNGVNCCYLDRLIFEASIE